jgi:hypothetical protein
MNHEVTVWAGKVAVEYGTVITPLRPSTALPPNQQ